MKVRGRAGGDSTLQMSAEYVYRFVNRWPLQHYDRMAAWRGLELLILRVRFLEYGLFLAWARAVFMQGVKQSQAEGRMRREREERETRRPHKSRTEWPVRRKEIPVMPAWPA